jgi:LmbE family N-acetylglucosaminyl deacetylase
VPESHVLSQPSPAVVSGKTVLAVCAHPDDESFGLGAVIDHLVKQGAEVAVLCFTHGEASSLGGEEKDLGALRLDELREAAAELAVTKVSLRCYRDGELQRESLDALAKEVRHAVEQTGADFLLVFDEGGVTGHPDHDRATEAAMSGAPGLPVLAWVVPTTVAEALNTEFGTTFCGRLPAEIDLVIDDIDRSVQWRAISCHRSQATGNPVLQKRLSLLGATEWLRWLRRP